VIDAQRKSHPLDPPCRGGPVGRLGPEQHPIAIQRHRSDDHLLAAGVHEPVHYAPAELHQAVEAAMTWHPKARSRAHLHPDLDQRP
jgi:hypothetical protein